MSKQKSKKLTFWSKYKIQNNFLDSGKGLVIPCVNHCRYRIGHFGVGRFQRDSFCGRKPVQAKHTVQNDTRDGADKNDDNQEEKADRWYDTTDQAMHPLYRKLALRLPAAA